VSKQLKFPLQGAGTAKLSGFVDAGRGHALTGLAPPFAASARSRRAKNSGRGA